MIQSTMVEIVMGLQTHFLRYKGTENYACPLPTDSKVLDG